MKHCKNFNFLFIFLMVVTLIAGSSILAAEKININKASVEELAVVKYIGPKIAERIVQYRDEKGPFNNTEDIMNVKGIGSKTYEKIKDMISIE